MSTSELPVPASETEVTAEWLRGALDAEFPLGVVDSFEARRIGEGYGLASRIFRFVLGGARIPGSVVVKLWSTDGPAGDREVRFFRELGPQTEGGVRIPHCHHAAFDPGAKRGVLVLEDLAPARQGDCLERLDLETARKLAVTLARLHGRWWRRPELDRTGWLPAVPLREAEWFRSRRETFLERFGRPEHRFVRRLIARIETADAIADRRLARSADTLLHQDLHLDNVVVTSDTGRPVLLDWACCARGPAVLDLADLVFTIAPADARETVLDDYLRELQARGVRELEPDSLRWQLGGALLRKFATWTLGVARWEPRSPREERMIEKSVSRAGRAVSGWRLVEPELFGFLDSEDE